MTTKIFHAIAEDRTGNAWRERFAAAWPDSRAWYFKEGDAARIWQTQVTTNHPETVDWPKHAAGSRSVARFEYLQGRLGRADLGDAFFEPPVYNSGFSGGMGTVYNAVYKPASGEAIYRWPGHAMRQSFAEFTPGNVEIAYSDGAPARAA